MARQLSGPTISAIVRGEDACAVLAAKLVGQSRAFLIVPLPGNEWRFSLKDEPGAAALLLASDTDAVTRDPR